MGESFMLRTAFLAGLYFWGCAAAFAADPQLMNLVMPEAKVVAGVNVTNAKTSPLGQFLLARIAASARPLPGFITATGFDPRADLTDLLFATAASPSSPGGLVLARGTFNVGQITMVVANHQNLEVQTFPGYTIIVTTNPNAKVQHAVAFIGSSIAVAGDAADVQAALDRNSGVNTLADATLAGEVNTLSATEDAWIVSSIAPRAKKPQALQAIQSFEGGVTFGANVQATGQAVANSPQNAAALASVIQLFVTGAAQNAALNQVLQSLQVNVTGATLNVSLSVPEAQVESLVNGLEARPRQEHSSARPGARQPASH
jgi:hypothetical protein